MKLYSRIMISVLIALAGAQSAWGASIGLFSDANCASCNLNVPNGGTRTLYITAFAEESWITASFRVAGLPAGWLTSPTVSPSAAQGFGDPFGIGSYVAFGTAQTGACVLLYTVELTATTDVSDATLHVAPNASPTDLYPDFPYLLLDAPGCSFCFVQADPGVLFLNSPRECTVGVESSTWGGVKEFYR